MMSFEDKIEKKKRDTEEVIYNRKRDSKIKHKQFQREKKESARYILGGCYYLIHRNVYL